MARKRGTRVFRVPCGPDQHTGLELLQSRSPAAMEARTVPKRATRLHRLDDDDGAGQSVAPQAAHSASLAEPTLQRQASKARARCAKCARRDPCGGRRVRAGSIATWPSAASPNGSGAMRRLKSFGDRARGDVLLAITDHSMMLTERFIRGLIASPEGVSAGVAERGISLLRRLRLEVPGLRSPRR
jgi:hypothetical protein